MESDNAVLNRRLLELATDPEVIASFGLAALVYIRAKDVDSALYKMTAELQRRLGITPEVIGWSRFQQLIYTVASQLTGSLPETESLAAIKIALLRKQYLQALEEYNQAKAAYDAVRATDPPPRYQDINTLPTREDFWPPGWPLEPEPGEDPLITAAKLKLWTQRIEDQYLAAMKVWNDSVDARDKAIQHYWDRYNWVDPGPPVPDPAIALWDEVVVVSNETALTYALVAFIIGMKPELLTGTLKGIGEIIQGFGEIVPL